jgi:hypothetical protein
LWTNNRCKHSGFKIHLKIEEINMNNQNNEKPTSNKIALGLALGVGFGLALGNAMGNIGAGLAIGIALGIAFGSQSEKDNKPD